MTQRVCEALLQEPLSEMSVTESPANPAFDVKAERVECPLKISVSISASLRKFLIHPGIVELTTGLWVLTKLNKS